METETLIDPVGVELASEVLADGEGPLLMLGGVFGENGYRLSLATWDLHDGEMRPSAKPVPLCPASVVAARKLAEQAIEVLPHAPLDPDDLSVLGRNDELVLSAIGSRPGVILIGLGWADGSGVIVIRSEDLGCWCACYGRPRRSWPVGGS
jgi:hypothetical protein